MYRELCLICWQVAEQQSQMLERQCDIRLPARYRDYLIVKRNYQLHSPDNVFSAAQVSRECLHHTVLAAIAEKICYSLAGYMRAVLLASFIGRF